MIERLSNIRNQCIVSNYADTGRECQLIFITSIRMKKNVVVGARRAASSETADFLGFLHTRVSGVNTEW